MTRHTLGWLWSRYQGAREKLSAAEGVHGAERRALEREVKALRDRLVVNYSPLVRYVTGRVLARAVYAVDREDVMSWGTIGLLDAVETYDPGRNTKFESYAISKIRWTILDELRKADPLSRRARARVQELEGARAALAQRFGRVATEQEVARQLGVGIADHRAFVDRCWRAQVESLETRLEHGGAPGGELHQVVADCSAVDPASAAEAAEVRAVLVEAIATLNEQERVVTTLYFYEGLTLREIGGVLGLSEGRISQVLRRSLARLREALPAGCAPPGVGDNR